MENKKIKLEDIPKINPYSAPDPYFDDLPQRIQARIHEQRTPERVWSLNWSWRRSWLSAGAAAAVAVLMYVSWPVRQDSIGVETLSQVASEDIVQYLQQQPNVSVQDLSESPKNRPLIDSLSTQPLQNLKASKKDILDQIPPEDLEDLI